MTYTTRTTWIVLGVVILILLVYSLYRIVQARRAIARAQRPVGVAMNDARRGEIVRVALNDVGETADKVWPDHG